MKTEEFSEIVNSFINLFKKSDLYFEYKKIDNQIYENKEIIELSKKKEELINNFSHAQNETEEEEILIKLGKIVDEINSYELCHKYYSLRSRIKSELEPIVQNILEKIW